MKVSVVICTYNRQEYILDALISVRDQTFSKDDYEVVLIDNNSTDNTPLLCMQFSQLKGKLHFNYFKETRQGLSYARNRGIEVAQGNIIIFLDDDAVAGRTYIEKVYEFFENHPNVGSMGGRIFPKFEEPQPSWLPNYLTPLFSIIDLGEVDKAFSKGKYPVGANMAFRKQVFEQCGVFNVNLGRTGKNLLGGEEKDIFYRIRQKNIQVWYAAQPWVYHIVPNARMTKGFIKAQAIGVGQSERLRIDKAFVDTCISYAKELAKWVASITIAIGYLLYGKVAKARMILTFRLWVSLGLLNVLKLR